MSLLPRSAGATQRAFRRGDRGREPCRGGTRGDGRGGPRRGRDRGRARGRGGLPGRPALVRQAALRTGAGAPRRARSGLACGPCQPLPRDVLPAHGSCPSGTCCRLTGPVPVGSQALLPADQHPVERLLARIDLVGIHRSLPNADFNVALAHLLATHHIVCAGSPGLRVRPPRPQHIRHLRNTARRCV